jgi:integrase
LSRPLPKWMHLSHGAYYLVRGNKWTKLSRSYHDALVEYARLVAGPDQAALADLVTRVLADLKPTIADSTYKHYLVCSRKMLKSFAQFTPQQVRPSHVAKFLDHHRGTPSMANLMHSFLRNVFKRAVRWGEVEADPTRDIEKFPTKARERYITVEEFNAIREQAPPTLQCLMDLAYITGQRLGDCRHARYADISDVGLYVKQQKTGARMLIEMTPDLAEVIARAKTLHQSVKGLTLFHRRDGSPIPYRTLHAQWVQACAAAGVEDAHFHDIRAASGTDAKAAGLDSQALLGHTTESSHRRYLRSKEVPIVTPVKARTK